MLAGNCVKMVALSSGTGVIGLANKRIVLTGGGTAGHVMPNIALIPRLKELGYEIHYIGGGAVEKELIQAVPGVTFHRISTGKLRRYFSFKNFTDPFRILRGVCQSLGIISRIKPNVAFSKGGFVGVPVVIGARLKRVPIILHESDMSVGLANRISAPFSDVVCTSFEPTAAKIKKRKGVYTGTPIREELQNGDAAAALRLFGFEDPNKPVLLCMGGSQGAVAVNRVLREALPLLFPDFNVVHLCGKGNLDPGLAGRPGYRQLEFAGAELPDIFALADVAVSRAGANAVFELLCLGLPALLVPLPSSASRGDQLQNAAYFEKRGCFDVVRQEDLTPAVLHEKIAGLYAKRVEYAARMRSAGIADSLQRIIAIIEKHALPSRQTALRS
jgi:UDP-N-acetylglucosamine--N-acetylmuramyl-(pentapeptide) pyrophosphoryl-undecaprenol N-acetylglucosamine transferase